MADHLHSHPDPDHARGIGAQVAVADIGRAFAIGIALNAAYILAEVFVGFAAHSVALFADAGHNLGDVIGLLAAWATARLGTRPPTRRYTYGLRRASILAALGNAIILLLVTGAIALEAVQRLVSPEPAAGFAIILVALAGVLVNGISAWLFVSGRERDLNIKAAFLHMAADAALALGVAVAGAVIMLTGWLWVDPAMSLVISIVIVAGTWSLLRDSTKLSLDAVPPGIAEEEVAAYFRTLPGVTELHDLHIWAMSTTETALTAHLVHDDVAAGNLLLPRITEEIRRRFGIRHATIQIETPATARRCEQRPDHVV